MPKPCHNHLGTISERSTHPISKTKKQKKSPHPQLGSTPATTHELVKTRAESSQTASKPLITGPIQRLKLPKNYNTATIQ